MFLYPGRGAKPVSVEQLRSTLTEAGLRSSAIPDGDLVWLTIDGDSDLRVTVDGGHATSAVLEGLPGDVSTLTILERVFGELGWEVGDEDEMG